MEPSLKEVLSHFQTQGEVVSCERYGCGHINETYLAVTAVYSAEAQQPGLPGYCRSAGEC